jgi:hypothetical protein
MVTAQSPAPMSAYLVTREGQELGTFKTSKIEKGLKTGFFRMSDLGWREASGWQGLFEIVGTNKAVAAPSLASLMPATNQHPPDGHNPYASPVFTGQTIAMDGSVVPLLVIQELKRTKPWVRLISVLMWIGCVLILAFLLISSMEQLSMGSQMLMKGDIAEGLGTMTGVAIFIALGAALVIYPTLKLTKYASNIGRLVESQSFTDLCAALREQRRFWKFHGILSIIYICVIGGVVFLKLKEKGMLH